MEEALDQISLGIERAVLRPFAKPVRVRSDDRDLLGSSNLSDDLVGIVASIGDHGLARHVFEQALGNGRFMLLPRCQLDVRRLAVCRRDRVELGRKTSCRAAQSISLDPPFPPAASWCARTTVASRSAPASSSMRSASKIAFHRPALAQRAKRLYTVFHLPKRSGRSRQGTPVRTRQTTALMNSRSPRLDFGPRRVGIASSTSDHSASVSSCRCIPMVDQDLGHRATWIYALAKTPCPTPLCPSLPIRQPGTAPSRRRCCARPRGRSPRPIGRGFIEARPGGAGRVRTRPENTTGARALARPPQVQPNLIRRVT